MQINEDVETVRKIQKESGYTKVIDKYRSTKGDSEKLDAAILQYKLNPTIETYSKVKNYMKDLEKVDFKKAVATIQLKKNYIILSQQDIEEIIDKLTIFSERQAQAKDYISFEDILRDMIEDAESE